MSVNPITRDTSRPVVSLDVETVDPVNGQLHSRLSIKYFYDVEAHLRRMEPSVREGFLLIFRDHLVNCLPCSGISSFQGLVFTSKLLQMPLGRTKNQISRAAGHLLDDVSHASMNVTTLKHLTCKEVSNSLWQGRLFLPVSNDAAQVAWLRLTP